MRTLAPIVLGLTLALAPPGAALAAPITVTVDGRSLGFPGADPQMVRGRVMVPLRGIFEALGASVAWDGPTQTINASRAATNVQLRIGDRLGYVNSRAVPLDVPAMLLHGTTMVPLRFVSESLNAEVGWSEYSQTVAITTNGATTPAVLQPVPDAPRITSLTHNANAWLNSGSTLQVVLTGTPGGQASYTVAGVVEASPMREVAPGRYEGSWRAASGQNDLAVTSASVVGTLRVGAQTSQSRADSTMSVDTQAPRITSVAPLPDSRLVPQPNVSAVFDDLLGSGIDPTTVRLSLDDHDITGQARVTNQWVSYRPAQPLAVGEHQVAISAADRAGNRVDRSWRFRTINVADVVRSFNWTAPAGAGPGDAVAIALEASPRGQARFAAGNVVRNQPLTEVQPGRYVGDYTLRREDHLADLRVTGVFTTSEGQAFTLEAENNSPVVAPPPIVTPPVQGAPEISSFTHNAAAWLNSGSTLRVVLIGTPGGQASYTVPGIVRASPMREVAAGRYEGQWRAAGGQSDLTVTGAAVIGTLRVGAQTSLIQAGTTLSVDTQAPRITAVAPLPDSRLVPQPNISAVFDDLVGSGIDPATVRMVLDNNDITAQAVVTGSFVSYRPTQPLVAGEHQVAVSAADRAGNRVDRAWRFNTINVAAVVTAFRWTAGAGAGPGDVVTITLEANPGGQARFAAGNVVRNQPMPEVQPGRYVGEYTLRREDKLAELRVTGTFTTREGQAYSFEAENTSPAVAPAPGVAPPAQPATLTPPRFTTPQSDERVGKTVVIQGTGTPHSRVGLRVEYRAKLLGLLAVGGALAELAVAVDANGRWQTAAIDLSTLLAGKDTQYLVTAWTIGADNQRSEAVTLRLLHQ